MTLPRGAAFDVRRRFFRSVQIVADAHRDDASEGYALTPARGRTHAARIVEGAARWGDGPCLDAHGTLRRGEVRVRGIPHSALGVGDRGGDGDSRCASSIRSTRSLEATVRKLTDRHPRVLPRARQRDVSARSCLRSSRPWPRPRAFITASAARQQLLEEIEAIRGEQGGARDVQRRVVALVDAFARKPSARYRGVLLVVDELGKSLEYAAQHHDRVDEVFLLQELAEVASRSGDRPVVLVTLLHQSFDRYAPRPHLRGTAPSG
jgi:hypothetical protein